MDANASRAGLDSHRGSAAVEGAADVVAVRFAVRHHIPVGVDAARAGRGVQRNPGAARPEFDAA